MFSVLRFLADRSGSALVRTGFGFTRCFMSHPARIRFTFESFFMGLISEMLDGWFKVSGALGIPVDSATVWRRGNSTLSGSFCAQKSLASWPK